MKLANSAFYGTITCLGSAAQVGVCIAGYPTTSPSFLDQNIVSLTVKAGYNRTFVTDVVGAAGITGAANSYCYQGSPASTQGGVRSFAGDSSGIVYATNFSTDCCAATGLANAAVCANLR